MSRIPRQVAEMALLADAQRFRELRLDALEDRLAADLRSGWSPSLLAEAEALVAEHPLRARLRASLMRAL